MATFVTFNDRLPDPTFGVNNAGVVDAAGIKGPGFANVSVTSDRPAQVSRTISGRGVHTESGAHKWEVNISYHPMRRDQFDVVQSFLDARNGRMNPFFVVLPQNSKPKNATFASYVTSNIIKVLGGHLADSSTLTIEAPGTFPASASFGDYFTISDPNDINHLKMYKVTRVETNALYQQGKVQPAVNHLRLHIMPPLTRFVADDAVVNWINPKMRVIQKGDTVEYQLNTDNLYNFQLNLEEILP
jgi:hypothetical protein